jgi:hypothetical protein
MMEVLLYCRVRMRSTSMEVSQWRSKMSKKSKKSRPNRFLVIEKPALPAAFLKNPNRHSHAVTSNL